MLESELKDAERRMQKAVDVLKEEFATVRAGRANPSLLNKIEVDYYGTATPLKQLANISAPEPRLLLVQPWDKSSLADVERAIMKSDLGLSPNNDGNVIRIPIPQLTEERRQELVKVVRKKAEEGRVSIRNIRRDINDQIKKAEKKGNISEDEARREQDKIQKMTDKYIEKVDNVLSVKEAEIMEV